MAGELTVSPLQLKNLVFQKVLVQTSTAISGNEEELEKLWAPDFDFEGVEFKVKVEVATNPDPAANEFMVTVELQLPNLEGTPKAPYSIDISAIGWFTLAQSVVDDRDEIVRVNGASLILGAMRELISSITSRSVLGLMTLPTLRLLPNARPKPEVTPVTPKTSGS